MRSTNTGRVHRAHDSSSSAKIYLDTVGTTPNGQRLVSYPALIPAVEGCNMFPTACFNNAIYNNLPIYANSLAEERDYLHKHIKLPNILPSTINVVTQCNLTQLSLEKNPHSLNKCTTILNFPVAPTTSAERNSYENLHNRVQHEIAETQLEQIKAHCFHRNL